MCECKCPCGCSFPSNQPGWKPPLVPHKHAELIKAWADCPQLEFQFRGDGLQNNCWYTMKTPDWSHSEVRIKPEVKPDSVFYTRLIPDRGHGLGNTQLPYDNTKVTFDGETGKLKSVELI